MVFLVEFGQFLSTVSLVLHFHLLFPVLECQERQQNILLFHMKIREEACRYLLLIGASRVFGMDLIPLLLAMCSCHGYSIGSLVLLLSAGDVTDAGVLVAGS